MTRPPEIQAIIDEIAGMAPHQSIAALNRTLAERSNRYNSAPQAELGGLSPDQMGQLLYGDWETRGALRLNERLAPEALAGAAVLADARTLLAFVQEAGAVKETVAGNLPRAAVALLLPKLRMDGARLTDTEAAGFKVRNESDLRWLPLLRHALRFAGLLVRRKGLRVSSRGRELLRAERAGELYALVFRTFFRTLDLRSLGFDHRHPGLQSTIAFSFYKLRSAARDWSGVDALSDAAWLPSAKEPPSEHEVAGADYRNFAFHHRVLAPLVQFGLLETRELPGANRWSGTSEFRVDPLFAQFMHFDFRRGAPPVRHDPFLMR